MPDRVTVFVDYQNIASWAARLFAPGGGAAPGHVDPLSLGRLLVARRRREAMLAEVRVYRGRPNPDRQPVSAAANDRQAAHWNRDDRVAVVRRPLRYPAQWPTLPAVEKGIDVALAVDVVRMAMEDAFDVAIVVSADTDLLPAVETLVDLQLAHVEVAAWSGMPRLRLPGTQLPWCHFLDERAFRAIEDRRDWTTPDD